MAEGGTVTLMCEYERLLRKTKSSKIVLSDMVVGNNMCVIGKDEP
jgi:hypothetical protein